MAWKVLLRKKLYSIITLSSITLTLTIIMIVIAVISHINSNLTRNAANNKLLLLTSLKYTGKGMSTQPPSYYFINDFNNNAGLVNKVGAVSFITIPIDYYKNKKRITLDIRYTDNIFWDIMNIKFLEGRQFTKEELEKGDKVVVIDEKTKILVFGNQKASGKFMEMQGMRLLVIGVVNNMDGLNFLSSANIFMPITLMEGVNNKETQGGAIGLTIYMNDKDIDKLNSQLNNYLSKMELPEWYKNVNGNFEIGIWSFLGNMLDIKNIKPIIAFLVPLLILLYLAMPIFNLYALFGMRLAERSCEIGLRKSFGASTITIRNQFIIENLFVVLAGSLIAFILTIASLNLINRSQLFNNSNIHLNFNAFFISLIVSVLFGLLAGFMPSVRISKTSIIDTINIKTND